MTRNVSKYTSEKPLLGAVICCTSITPEERSVLADYAQQMGAEHKLDLTADVTHLLVGATNTPKYQYVAREREDVKVLRPGWVQAVRERWMEDRDLDLNVLDAEYLVPAFACLKICITGFDDLNVRAEIASTVRKHGGEYTGDLTKDVTHLIAAEPVGKKFEYATIWQKKIVSMKWFNESIERGMQLDESQYHPSLPQDEQGATAWNRQRRKDLPSGKRMQDGPHALEPVRKLRRTASSKLSSQTDTMWGEIVGDNQREPANNNRDVLRPTKSMPVMKQADAHEPSSRVGNAQGIHATLKASRSDQCLTGLMFYLDGFDPKQRSIVQSALSGMGAQVYDSLEGLLHGDRAEHENSLGMVPHQYESSNLHLLENVSLKPTIVTELWLEKCIIEKAFIPPKHYPLGGLLQKIQVPEIASFTINATGFTSIETLHISKAVTMVGARYEQVFTPQCSVLICKSGALNQSKLFHARQWNIPALTEQWLWELLSKATIPALDQHVVPNEQDSDNDIHKQFYKNRRHSEPQSDERANQTSEAGTTPDHHSRESLNRSRAGNPRAAPAVDVSKPEIEHLLRRSSHTDADSSLDGLQSIPPKLPSKLFADDTMAKPQSTEDSRNQEAAGKPGVGGRLGADIREASQKTSATTNHSGGDEAVNSAIQELLNVKARAKSAQKDSDKSSRDQTKKKILGRALSNLSNSSRTSTARVSRASSIDSLNTDGVGPELAPLSANGRIENDSAGHRGQGVSLLGRALPRNTTLSQNQVSQPIDLSDPSFPRDEFNETEAVPQLTQLGYEDSEETIALRAKLAEKRRTKRQTAQAAGESQLPAATKGKGLKKRVIKDDETILALEGQSGWGGGRRTRRKEKDLGDEMF